MERQVSTCDAGQLASSSDEQRIWNAGRMKMMGACKGCRRAPRPTRNSKAVEMTVFRCNTSY